MISSIYETYKNAVTPHGIHKNKTVPEIAMATILTFTYNQHVTPHWKYVLCCCGKCTIIVIPGK